MAKPYAFRVSDFTPQAKERIAHEIAETRELGTSWPQVAGRYNVSERSTSAWTGKGMSPAAQHARRGSTGRPRLSTAEEEQEIFDRARARRAQHGAIDGAWTRAAIAEVTGPAIGGPDTSSHAFYITFPTDSLSSCKSF
jgi:transposase